MSDFPELSRRWQSAPLGELIDHVLSAYHRPQLAELRRIDALTRRVVEAHPDETRLGELLQFIPAFHDELVAHMAKEEQNLFPLLRRGDAAMATGPAEVMRHEHDTAEDALRHLRGLTDDYRLPPHAGELWRELWRRLEAFELALREHMFLENDILFARAMKS